jgi:hypothetical protein
MFRIIVFQLIALYLLFTGIAGASTALLYFEAQGIAGYSSEKEDVMYYSLHQDDSMQKPSLGFDYIQKISSGTRDIATIALQGRAAYDDTYKYYTEPQLYNAYILFKTPLADAWAGHSRPAFGLSSYLDSHALLLPTLAMKGYGYDRDWGAGLYREFSKGDVRISTTTGTGMPLYFKDNYLISARMSYGVLSQDNINIGLSGSYGEILETMGYHLISDEPMPIRFGGIDFNYLWDYFEVKLEAVTGKIMEENTLALFGRFGVNLLKENRLKLEFQPVYTKIADIDNYELYSSIAYIATSDLTFRSMYRYDDSMKDHSVILQAYYYLKIL